jgi:hypothetical protein
VENVPQINTGRLTEIKPKQLSLAMSEDGDLVESLNIHSICSPISREVEDEFGSKLISPRDEIVEELNSIKFNESVRNKAIKEANAIFSPLSNTLNNSFAREADPSFEKPKFIQFVSNRSSALHS